MPDDWYYLKSKTQHGPVSFKRLQSLVRKGQLLSTDLVWVRGMSEWKSAESIDGLFESTNHTSEPSFDSFPPSTNERPLTGFELEEGVLEEFTPRLPQQNLGLWRFVLVYLAAVITFVLFLVGMKILSDLQPEMVEKQLSWASTITLIVFLSFLEAVAICILPVVAGHYWPEQSQYVGKLRDRDLYVYLPKRFIGWIGYYLASILAVISCVGIFLLVLVLLALLFFVAVAPFLAIKRCRVCGAEIPSITPTCPHCQASNP